MLFVFILMFVYTDASDCDISDEFTWENVSYSFFFDCSITYDDAVGECNNTGMQILRLKTIKEMQYLSSVIVKQGYSPAVWVSGICPDIGRAPNVDVKCAKFSANITDEVTRGYVVLTSECHDSLGWICEGKTDVHPCPPAATPRTTSTTTPTTTAITTAATPTTTAITSATPPTTAITTPKTTAITTTPATTVITTRHVRTPRATTVITPATTPGTGIPTPATSTTTHATTATTAITTTPAATVITTTHVTTPATTSTTHASTPTTATLVTTPATPATTATPVTPPPTYRTSYTSSVVQTACGELQETRQGLNLYFLFGMCEQPIPAAIRQCSAHNSSLAVLASEDELQYLAARIGGQKNGSWSFWIGGFMQTGNCVIVSFDQSVVANITDRKFTISIGRNCHESHVFVCKTVTDFAHENLVLQRRKQGSVMDHRPTAIFLGSVGVAVMAAVLLFVVVIDVPNLVADVRRAKQNVKRFTTHSTRNAQPKDAAKTTP